MKSARRLPALSQRPRKRHFVSVLVPAVTLVICLAVRRMEGSGRAGGLTLRGHAVHALEDIAAGLTPGRLGEDLRYPVEGMPPAVPGGTAGGEAR